MWHVLEHVPDLDFQIKELKRLFAYDVPIHFWHFSKKAIELLFQKENMKLSKVLPMKFDSFYVSLLSEKYKTGKMNYFSAFFVGLRSNWKARRTNEYSSLIYVLKNK